MSFTNQFPDLNGPTQLPAMGMPAKKGGETQHPMGKKMPPHPMGRKMPPHPLKGGKCK